MATAKSVGLYNKENCLLLTKLAVYDALHDFGDNFKEDKRPIRDGLILLSPNCEQANISELSQKKKTGIENESFKEVSGQNFSDFFNTFIKSNSYINITNRLYRIVATNRESIRNGEELYNFLDNSIHGQSKDILNFAFLTDYDNQHINNLIAEGTNKNSRFYVIRNREYYSDPAIKLTKINYVNATEVEDNDSLPIIYSHYDIANSSFFNDFYSKSDITMFGIKGQNHDEIHIKQGTITKEIKNPKSSNSIRKATEIIKHLLGISKKVETVEEKILKYIPFIQKRSGDWCQAISTLDNSRVYKPPIPNNTIKILITGDKILLSYALLVGANVLFLKLSEGGNPPMCVFFYNGNANTIISEREILYNYFIQPSSVDGKTGLNQYEEIMSIVKEKFDELTQYIKAVFLEINTNIEKYINEDTLIQMLTYINNIIDNYNKLKELEIAYKYKEETVERINKLISTDIALTPIDEINLRRTMIFIEKFNRNRETYNLKSPLQYKSHPILSKLELFNKVQSIFNKSQSYSDRISKDVGYLQYLVNSLPPSEEDMYRRSFINILKILYDKDITQGRTNKPLYPKFYKAISTYKSTIFKDYPDFIALFPNRVVRGGGYNDFSNFEFNETHNDLIILINSINNQHVNSDEYYDTNYYETDDTQTFINIYDREKYILTDFFSDSKRITKFKDIFLFAFKLIFEDIINLDSREEFKEIQANHEAFFNTILIPILSQPQTKWISIINTIPNYKDFIILLFDQFFNKDYFNSLFIQRLNTPHNITIKNKLIMKEEFGRLHPSLKAKVLQLKKKNPSIPISKIVELIKNKYRFGSKTRKLYRPQSISHKQTFSVKSKPPPIRVYGGKRTRKQQKLSKRYNKTRKTSKRS